MKTMVTYSPTALFAFVRIIEALVAMQGACAGLWQHAVQSITPMWLQRHLVLKEKLRELGVNHHYDLRDVSTFKRHIVKTRSDPMWRRAWWTMCLIQILEDKFTTRVLCGVITIVSLIVMCTMANYGSMVVGLATFVGIWILLENQYLIAEALTDQIKTDSFYRDYVKWQSTTVEDLVAEDRDLPTQVLRIHDTVSELGGHVSVDDAIKGEVYVDPFLYVSVLPMWVSCIPGLRFLRMCVLQWGDDEFETGGFATRARRSL
jgi:hypothetical protein